MGHSKEDLLKLAKFVNEIANEPGNEWFINEIQQTGHINKRISINKSELSFEAFVRLQKSIFKKKAMEFYKYIPNESLKNELIKDFIEMSWYKMLNVIERYFLFAYYQMENMLNYYLLVNDCYTKISSNKSKYNMPLTDKFVVDCYGYFFDNKGAKIELSKVKSIWAKLLFWAIEEASYDWFKSNKSNFDNLVNLRNFESHRNSADINQYAIKQVNNFKIGDDSNLSYTISILKRIKSTIK